MSSGAVAHRDRTTHAIALGTAAVGSVAAIALDDPLLFIPIALGLVSSWGLALVRLREREQERAQTQRIIDAYERGAVAPSDLE